MSERINDVVFWTQPCRRMVVKATVKISRTRWKYGRLHSWLLNHLYPPDATVTVGESR